MLRFFRNHEYFVTVGFDGYMENLTAKSIFEKSFMADLGAFLHCFLYLLGRGGAKSLIVY